MSDTVYPNLVEGLQRLGVDQQSVPSLLRYQQMLLEWNARFNLTAITDPAEIQTKHFLDALSLLTVFDRPRAQVLDIGSGAGFPGLPLKIARPQWRVTLIEATNKKVTFLRHVIEELQLQDVTVIHDRAEALAHARPLRASFEMVTARAVAALPVLLEYCVPYCRVGGCIILPKKGALTEEIAWGKRAATQLGCMLETDVPVDLPGLHDGRRLLLWRQQRECPTQYPRNGSVIARKPLG